MAKIGRPQKKIDWEEFDKLLSYQCTQIEMADFFDCDVDTLNNACLRERGRSLSDIWSKKKSLGKIRLRKAQMRIVENGGPGAATMAIYLDKKMFPDERFDVPPPPPTPESSAFGLAPERKVSFSEFVEKTGYPAPYSKQIEMQRFGFEQTDPRELLGARGYGKTDYLTILGTAYDIYLNGSTTSNLIITKSKTRNTAIMGEIAMALKANGVPLEKENATCVRVEGLKGKDHSAEAITIKSSFRGRHPKRILMDDPVTEEDVSEAMRTLVKRKYDEAYKLCSNLVVIGQPAHAHDLYADLRPLLLKMEVPHGSIPELDADLDAMLRAGVSKASIEMSYHLRVPVDGTTPFANVKYMDDFPNGESVAFIDPSDGGDYTALSIVRGVMDGVAAVGDCWQKAWFHCIDDLTDLLKAYRVQKVWFETNATGSQPVGQLRALWAPLGISVQGVHSDTNKHALIMQAGSFAHMIHLSRKSSQTWLKLVVQYELKAKFDDPPDSLARCLERLGFIRGKR